VRPYRLEA